MTPAQPHLRPDPAWKLCQTDQRQHNGRYQYCNQYSYHPYGSNGYRPMGTYRPYRSAPAYVVAPDPRIISVEAAD